MEKSTYSLNTCNKRFGFPVTYVTSPAVTNERHSAELKHLKDFNFMNSCDKIWARKTWVRDYSHRVSVLCEVSPPVPRANPLQMLSRSLGEKSYSPIFSPRLQDKIWVRKAGYCVNILPAPWFFWCFAEHSFWNSWKSTGYAIFTWH